MLVKCWHFCVTNMKYGCRGGQPHEFTGIFENKSIKIEVCRRCNVKKRYNKRAKGRIDNLAYLKDHTRQFAQPNGKTKRIYNKIYKPELMTIKL